MSIGAEEVMKESMVANVHIRHEKYLGVNPVFGLSFDDKYFSFIDPEQGNGITSIPHDRILKIEFYEPED